ncbi:uncharacterized protein K444DRAFT_561395 [Hyaloscypha bicolor E]|uniref:Uncharacterized protein n=1 Tax=Hyaloscypha bicolor E TaxID=1095630 RepID=A0A2J6TB67_9HELO|nr:uncharacterized protein K444DRAFT_561395 [Hyaloscypha bicolor E]PMD60274.1 hypothetical protein K444DRAFT_561395 [Hyaloscypha bicolor E]
MLCGAPQSSPFTLPCPSSHANESSSYTCLQMRLRQAMNVLLRKCLHMGALWAAALHNCFPSQLLPITTASHHNCFPSQLLPITTASHHNCFPSQLLTRSSGSRIRPGSLWRYGAADREPKVRDE